MNQTDKHLRLLCEAVLRGRDVEARALAAQFYRPLPKGSSEIRAWFDGSCWPNPGGHAGYGVIVKRNGSVIHSKAVYLGHGPHLSNNVSEYAGLIAVLRFLLQAGLTSATVYGDSQMVVEQLQGRIKARHGLYLPYYREAKDLISRLPDVRLAWVSRGQNTEADKLSREGLPCPLKDA